MAAGLPLPACAFHAPETAPGRLWRAPEKSDVPARKTGSKPAPAFPRARHARKPAPAWPRCAHRRAGHLIRAPDRHPPHQRASDLGSDGPWPQAAFPKSGHIAPKPRPIACPAKPARASNQTTKARSAPAESGFSPPPPIAQCPARKAPDSIRRHIRDKLPAHAPDARNDDTSKRAESDAPQAPPRNADNAADARRCGIR